MPQGVGRDAGAARLKLESPPHVGRRQAPAALREKQRPALALVERRTPAGEVAVERAPGVLARGDDARAAPLALHPHLLGVWVGADRVQVHELLGAQPGRVGQLEHGAIAQVERRGAGDPLEQLHHLGRLQHLRQVGVLLRARDQVGRVGVDLPALEQVAVEGADRGQLARHGGFRRAALAQHRGEAAQVAVRELSRPEAAAGGPLAQLGEVDAVGAPRLLPHAARPLPVVERSQGSLPNGFHPGAHVTKARSSRLGRLRRVRISPR